MEFVCTVTFGAGGGQGAGGPVLFYTEGLYRLTFLQDYPGTPLMQLCFKYRPETTVPETGAQKAEGALEWREPRLGARTPHTAQPSLCPEETRPHAPPPWKGNRLNFQHGSPQE